jgi:hypothetical protein
MGVIRNVIFFGSLEIFVNDPDNTSPIFDAVPLNGIVVMIPDGLSRVQTKVEPGSQ